MAKVTHIGLLKTVEVPNGTPLTELDNDIDFGCRMGSCGTCVIQVLAGAEQLSEMQEDEKYFLASLGLDNGPYRLACQCKIYGDILIKQ